MNKKLTLTPVAFLIGLAFCGGALGQVAPAPTALPQGGSFVVGGGTISNTAPATLGVKVTAQQGGNAMINWGGGFNIGQDATVNFTSTATAAGLKNIVNVDTSGSMSNLAGTITGPNNASILVVNPNGITAYAGANLGRVGNNATALYLVAGRASFANGNVTIELNSAPIVLPARDARAPTETNYVPAMGTDPFEIAGAPNTGVRLAAPAGYAGESLTLPHGLFVDQYGPASAGMNDSSFRSQVIDVSNLGAVHFGTAKNGVGSYRLGSSQTLDVGSNFSAFLDATDMQTFNTDASKLSTVVLNGASNVALEGHTGDLRLGGTLTDLDLWLKVHGALGSLASAPVLSGRQWLDLNFGTTGSFAKGFTMSADATVGELAPFVDLKSAAPMTLDSVSLTGNLPFNLTAPSITFVNSNVAVSGVNATVNLKASTGDVALANSTVSGQLASVDASAGTVSVDKTSLLQAAGGSMFVNGTGKTTFDSATLRAQDAAVVSSPSVLGPVNSDPGISSGGKRVDTTLSVTAKNISVAGTLKAGERAVVPPPVVVQPPAPVEPPPPVVQPPVVVPPPAPVEPPVVTPPPVEPPPVVTPPVEPPPVVTPPKPELPPVNPCAANPLACVPEYAKDPRVTTNPVQFQLVTDTKVIRLEGSQFRVPSALQIGSRARVDVDDDVVRRARMPKMPHEK
ncbi:filamentous hemagglutinin N-terminal domain-containing protein [Ramlibacter alkalitolerans]|uniref:Filamentous hemagglutinin N-terminal domain-containing protein n=1 Tax=Ramlibacter alkalitolerans TaxID=2039631 RepID=A0ABS1JUJ3_9BURK|nr:filamentous hemagglutinin N-terminal domain-containing protein [Ramlibacter alkalitolerans]MBL0427796.1 filamentous hemagglutinin N-terminal domain-containing protein [Ramlibacter alkalitolerans]